MAGKSPLRIYALGSLLAVHWQYPGKVTKDFEFALNGQPLSRPMLGVELTPQAEYLLVAHRPDASHRRRLVLEITHGDTLIARHAQEALVGFDAFAVTQLTPPTRMRLWRALTQEVFSTFPDLDRQSHLRVVAPSFTPARRAVQLADGSVYVHLDAATSTPAIVAMAIEPIPDDNEPRVTCALQATDGLHLVLPPEFSHVTGSTLQVLARGEKLWVPFVVARETITRSDLSLSRFLGTHVDDTEALVGTFVQKLQTPVAQSKRKNARKAPTRTLAGRVDGIRNGSLEGWIVDPSQPFVPMAVDVVIDGESHGTTTATQLCTTSAQSGLTGYHGFSVPLPDAVFDGQQKTIDVYVSGSEHALNGSPVLTGPGHFDGRLHVDRHGRLHGWIKERVAGIRRFDLRVLLDDEPIALVNAKPAVRPSQPEDIPTDAACFDIALPTQAFDGNRHAITLRVVSRAGNRDIPVGCEVKSDYRCEIGTLSPHGIEGRVVDNAYPLRTLILQAYINDCPGHTCTVLPAANEADIAARGAFSLALDQPAIDTGPVRIGLRVAHSDHELATRTLYPVTFNNVIACLSTIAQDLNAAIGQGSLTPEQAATRDWVRSQLLANTIRQLRETRSVNGALAVNLDTNPIASRPDPISPVTDVIIPVYKGLKETLDCIQSVLQAQVQASHELIVINDCSPDLKLRSALRKLAREHRFTYLENRSNLGFVGTVNRGMRLHPDRDVVLLNADTLVPNRWLDRLRRTAHSQANIATVTPFSNNATICSFPNFCADNQLPAGASVATLDALFAECNPEVVVDIPTAVGFCMYIKRAALAEVGYFDEVRWGKGYGEENDFCLRAAMIGWRHVLGGDLFVQHRGAVSFGTTQQQQLTANLQSLGQLYPDYHRCIADFIDRDPAAVYRRRVQKRLLQQTVRTPFLFVMHTLGGGTAKAATELAAGLRQEGQDVLFLTPSVTRRGLWCLAGQDSTNILSYDVNADMDAFIADLRELGIAHIHFHSVVGYQASVLSIPALLGVTYDFTTHDYLPICPRINLMTAANTYCADAQFNVRECAQCVKQSPLDTPVQHLFTDLGDRITSWRAEFQRFLQGARHLFAPSHDVAERFARHIPLPQIVVRAHPSTPHKIRFAWNPPATAVVNVAVIGAIGPHKGFELLKSCVIHAQAHELPIRFVIVGYTCDDSQLAHYSNVIITGEYAHDAIGTILQAHDCSVALFLSQWPETFQYTLSEALLHNLLPVATPFGAVAERLRRYKIGTLLPENARVGTVNAALLATMDQAPVRRSIVLATAYRRLLEDYYGLRPDVASTAARAA